MLTSPGFESESSFHGSSRAESFPDPNESLSDHRNDEWGIISESNDGSGMNETFGSDDGDYVRPGFLILEGVESNSGNETTNLSIPGTYSLPTEIDTLSELNQGAETVHGNSVILRKRSLFICFLSTAALFSTSLGFLMWERRTLQSSSAKLGQEIERLERENALKLKEQMERLEHEKQEEIRRLEQEKEDIKASCSSKPIWDDIPENPNDFTIVDNCWLKAKASVQFGPCSDETKSSLSEFKTRAWQELRDMWNATSSFDKAATLATIAGLGHRDPANVSDEAEKEAWPFSHYMGFGATGKAFASNMMNDGGSSTKFDFEEAKASLTQASEAVADAVLTATEAMKDLSTDSVSHLAAALKGASHTVKKDPITMNGIFEAGKAISSASLAMGKVMTETSDILAVKVTEMMEDPFSFFEFETEMMD